MSFRNDDGQFSSDPENLFSSSTVESEYSHTTGKTQNWFLQELLAHSYLTSWANAKVKLHSQVHFESKMILGPKKCWVQKSVNSKKKFRSCHRVG